MFYKCSHPNTGSMLYKYSYDTNVDTSDPKNYLGAAVKSPKADQDKIVRTLKLLRALKP